MERHWKAVDQPVAIAATLRAIHAPYIFENSMLLAGVAITGWRLDPLPSGDQAGLSSSLSPRYCWRRSRAVLYRRLTITPGCRRSAGFAILARHPFVPSNQVDAALFVGLGLAMGFGGRWLRRAQAEAVDVTHRLVERQAHLQSILDTVPDAMIVIDDLAIVQSFSPAAERLFGWTRDEVVGRNVNMLMSSPDHDAHDSYIEHYKQTGERRIIGLPRIVTALRRDGSVIPVELFVGETKTGDQLFFTGFLQDLTARQAAESRAQTLQTELIHLARLSDMGEMTAVLAHELNQPLSAISNYLKGGQRVLETEKPDSRAIPAARRGGLNKPRGPADHPADARFREPAARRRAGPRACANSSRKRAGSASWAPANRESVRVSSGTLPSTRCWSTRSRCSRWFSISCATRQREAMDNTGNLRELVRWRPKAAAENGHGSWCLSSVIPGSGIDPLFSRHIVSSRSSSTKGFPDGRRPFHLPHDHRVPGRSHLDGDQPEGGTIIFLFHGHRSGSLAEGRTDDGGRARHRRRRGRSRTFLGFLPETAGVRR